VAGASFTDGTLTGADECIPTVGTCTHKGIHLPDHGEAWTSAWMLDENLLAQNRVRCSLTLKTLPLTFTRSVSLAGTSILLDYELLNHSDEQQAFLWALHPLFSFHDGDRLYLPEEVKQVKVISARHPDTACGTLWSWPRPQPGVDLEALTLEDNDAYAKFFTGRLHQTLARIENSITGDRLELRWDAAAAPFLGVWLTRGGWRGAHHPAVEPTNSPHEDLASALQEPNPTLFLAPGESRHWRVQIQVSTANSRSG
jgi:hypothetical protein